ncbi:hypothetical protein CJ177_09025 [Rhodococcus sp. ACPA1]|nr:hypothetical protein CJ177_09025 [Rhodococcus sp. ACPA1]
MRLRAFEGHSVLLKALDLEIASKDADLRTEISARSAARTSGEISLAQTLSPEDWWTDSDYALVAQDLVIRAPHAPICGQFGDGHLIGVEGDRQGCDGGRVAWGDVGCGVRCRPGCRIERGPFGWCRHGRRPMRRGCTRRARGPGRHR